MSEHGRNVENWFWACGTQAGEGEILPDLVLANRMPDELLRKAWTADIWAGESRKEGRPEPIERQECRWECGSLASQQPPSTTFKEPPEVGLLTE